MLVSGVKKSTFPEIGHVAYQIEVKEISKSVQANVRPITCLTSDASLTADPGVASSIPAWSHTLVEIDHEIIFYGHSPPFR